MKRGLYITDGYYVNLHNVSVWRIKDGFIQLQLSDFYLIEIKVDGSDVYIGGDENFSVEINEFKRIEREIFEYMGIKQISCSTKESVATV